MNAGLTESHNLESLRMEMEKSFSLITFPTSIRLNSSPLALLMAQAVKNPPANAGDAGLIPGWEDLLEEEMATQPSILAWRIPWTEEPGGPQSGGCKRVRHD